MPVQEELEDPLKPLDLICEPDPRQKMFAYGLEDSHADLSEIILNDAVPRDVSQLFETAKNLSLYSWFVYRFHQVSELIAFAALEMALRERYFVENPSLRKDQSPTLYRLLQHAKSKQWIKNEGFPSLYERARSMASYQKLLEVMVGHDFERDSTVLIENPNEEEVEAAINNLNMAESISSTVHKIRNNLAHGSNILHPNSIATLTTISELINQVHR